MKVTLTFQLPEENDEHEDAIKGGRWKAVVQALDEHLRATIKHGSDEIQAKHYQEIRDRLHEATEEQNVWLWN